ncbi:hypothetical protein GCM10020331_080870 [Ectobacillus funiculus]
MNKSVIRRKRGKYEKDLQHYGRNSLHFSKKRMTVIALIAIMFIPVLYAGTYLYAFKDPYGKT